MGFSRVMAVVASRRLWRGLIAQVGVREVGGGATRRAEATTGAAALSMKLLLRLPWRGRAQHCSGGPDCGKRRWRERVSPRISGKRMQKEEDGSAGPRRVGQNGMKQ